jgi:hypothetical protein
MGGERVVTERNVMDNSLEAELKNFFKSGKRCVLIHGRNEQKRREVFDYFIRGTLGNYCVYMFEEDLRRADPYVVNC